MNFDVNFYINILLAILFLGFSILSSLSIRAIFKQKNIVVYSRISRQTGLIEVLDVNIALLVILALVITKHYIYIPVIALFAFFIMSITRLQSGVANEGIFIGMTFIPWEQVKAYKLINDDFNTVQVKFRANKRQYIMRCDKESLGDLRAILRKFQVVEQETNQN